MLSQRERVFIDRMDKVLREIGTLNPPNPADVRAISTNLRVAVSAAQRLDSAIGALRSQDWTSVDSYLGQAEQIVSREGVT